MGSLNKVVLWLPYMKWTVEAPKRRNRAFWLILTAKNLNFQAQRLYLIPTIPTKGVDGFPDQSCSMVALHEMALEASRGLKKAKMAFSTSKNLNFRAQRLYSTPTIEMSYQDGFSDQSCSIIALHDFASRGL